MRGNVLSLFLGFLTMLFPKTAPAQVLQLRTPLPEVVATTAAWQIANEPIIVAASSTTPRAKCEISTVRWWQDQRISARAGLRRHHPRALHRSVRPDRSRSDAGTYERARIWEMAGPSGRGATPFPVATAAAVVVVQAESLPVGTAGTVRDARHRDRDTAVSRTDAVDRGLDSAGDGDARHLARVQQRALVPATAPRRRIRRNASSGFGEYHGFPGCTAMNGNPNAIWVTVVDGGPLAPYTKRWARLVHYATATTTMSYRVPFGCWAGSALRPIRRPKRSIRSFLFS